MLPNMGTKTKSNFWDNWTKTKQEHCKYWTSNVPNKELSTCTKNLKSISYYKQFVYDQLKNNLPENFINFFTLNTQLHQRNTRKNSLTVPNAKISRHGSNPITVKAIKQWNKYKKLSILTFIPQKWHIPNL